MVSTFWRQVSVVRCCHPLRRSVVPQSSMAGLSQGLGLRVGLPALRLVSGQLACRRGAVTGHATADRVLGRVTGGRAEWWLRSYEQYVGLAEVRQAQAKVIQAEHEFLTLQSERRQKQQQLTSIQSHLRTINAELDKVHRGDERYLSLLTQAHSIIKDETNMQQELEFLEQSERGKFTALSSAVRDSHEKERARAERTKYWGIIGSIIGAFIGILGTSVSNYLRMRELRGIVSDSAEGGVELKALVGQLSDVIQTQHNRTQVFLSDVKGLTGEATAVGAAGGAIVGKSAAGSSVVQLETQTQQILDLVRTQDGAMRQEMADIRGILARAKAIDEDGNVLYVGPEVEEKLDSIEKNLEWKIKMNGLWTAAFIYGAFALTLPVLYNIFKGGS